MAINRTHKINKYTTVDNYFINDINLKPEGKGYLLFMLSKPDNWNFNFTYLTKALGVGEKALRSNIKKLEDLHYLKRERLRDENGHYIWIYHWYEKPFDLELNLSISPYSPSGQMVEGNAVEGDIYQDLYKLNTDINKDKYDKEDKTKKYEVNHNFLTNELIRIGFISKDEISSIYFDDMFENYLEGGYSPKELLGAIHYITPRVMNRNFVDEDGNEIKNKYGYFKNAMESNFRKLNSYSQELYPDDPNDKFWDDYEL